MFGAQWAKCPESGKPEPLIMSQSKLFDYLREFASKLQIKSRKHSYSLSLFTFPVHVLVNPGYC